jgi:hypothetical protein
MPNKKHETVITLGGPGDMVAALPYMLNYVPTESIVLVCLNGPKHRMGMVMRYDLPLTAYPELFCENALPRLSSARPDAVLVVIYGDAPPADGLPHRDFVDAAVAAIDGINLPQLDVIYTYDDRWWSYICRNTSCCPPEGKPVDSGSATSARLRAEHAYAGTSVLADRGALARTVAVEPALDVVARGVAIDAAIERGVGLSPETARRLGHRMVLDLLDRFADPRKRISDPEIDELVGVCEHLWGRDEFLIHGADRDDRQSLIRIMTDVVRRVPPPYDAPVCSILAWLAYVHGDGTLANIAVDRALACEPSYSLAVLIRSGLDRAVPPSLLQEAIEGATDDLHGRSAAG